MSCKCYGLGWPVPDGCHAGGFDCICSNNCCNTGRWADDGDGYEDFMPDENICRCTAEEEE